MFAISPSPLTTATLSFPLNHLTECKSPQDVTSKGHVNANGWPRNVDTDSDGSKIKREEKNYKYM